MSDSTTAGNPPSAKSDIWIAIGVVACLALGASVTFLMTGSHDTDGKPHKSVVQDGQAIVSHGKVDNPTASPTAPIATAATAKSPSGESDYIPVTFDTLASFYYEPPPIGDEGEHQDRGRQAPERSDSRAGSRAGWKRRWQSRASWCPFKTERGATKSFLLVKDAVLLLLRPHAAHERMDELRYERRQIDQADHRPGCHDLRYAACQRRKRAGRCAEYLSARLRRRCGTS